LINRANLPVFRQSGHRCLTANCFRSFKYERRISPPSSVFKGALSALLCSTAIGSGENELRRYSWTTKADRWVDGNEKRGEFDVAARSLLLEGLSICAVDDSLKQKGAGVDGPFLGRLDRDKLRLLASLISRIWTKWTPGTANCNPDC